MIRKVVLCASIMFLTAVNAFAYSGACVIWGQPNGQYLPIPFAGDSTGFGRARDACIRRGGGVITIGPGCESVITTYPNGAGILVIKTFGSGWIADPFSLTGTTFSNLRIARLGPTSSAGVGGAIRIIEGSTFQESGAGIQAAHDDLPAAGGTILIGSGAMNYTSTINITKNNVIIQGAGRGTQLINTAGVDAFNITASNVTIRDLRINGNKASVADGEGFHITGANVNIIDCYVENTPDYGIHFHTGSSNGYATGNFVSAVGDATSVEGAGIVCHDGTNYRFVNNQIDGVKTYGVYVQGTANKVTVEGNVITNSVLDGILSDSTSYHVSIIGNNIRNSGENGITANSDTTLVGDNFISQSGAGSVNGFGLWANGRARGSSWWGNQVVSSKGYGIAWHPDGVSSQGAGLSIFSNFILNTSGFGIDILAPSTCGVNDVMIGNNYIIGTGQNQAGIRVTSNAGSNGINRVHIVGNVIKNSVDDGIEVSSGGSAGIQDLFITENHILNNVDDAIVLAGGTAATAFISDNTMKGNGQNTIDANASWNIASFAERFNQSTISAVEDTVRVNGVVTVDNNKWMNWRNSSNVPMPVFRVDSVNVLKVQPLTGGSFDVMGSDGVLRGRFFGSGGLNITGTGAQYQLGGFVYLIDSGNDRRIVQKDASGSIAFRNAANNANLTWLDDVGNQWFSNSVNVVDSLSTDGTFRLYGSTSDVLMPSTGNILEFTNDGPNLIRASDAVGTLSFQTGGTTTRLSIADDGDINVGSNYQFKLGSSSQALLPAHDNGSLIYCTDCDRGTVPCATGGGPDGAVAKRENGAWNCD